MDRTQNTDITWGIAERVWWSLTCGTMMFFFQVVFVFSFILGVVMAMADIPREPYALAVQLAGASIGLIVNIWIIKRLLSKRYSNFSITVTHHQRDGSTS